jgi:hypothetical protein
MEIFIFYNKNETYIYHYSYYNKNAFSILLFSKYKRKNLSACKNLSKRGCPEIPDLFLK